jgi:NitT/TauT family transport system permease protein
MKKRKRLKFLRVKQPISDVWKISLGIIGIAVLIVGYSWISYRQHLRNPDDTTLPNFGQMVEGIKLATTPEENPLTAAFGLKEESQDWWSRLNRTWLAQDTWATYKRLFLGLMWGCSISIVLGTLLGCYPWLAAKCIPVLSFLAKVPGTAMLAVFFVIVGTGESMFITMIGFGVLPTLTQAIYLAARDDLHEEEINKAYTLGASNLEVIWNVVFQKILPKVLDNVQLQIGPAMVYLIAAEMLVGEVGMGFRIRSQQRLQHMNVVYDYLILLGITGLLMDRGMVLLRQWLCPWFQKGNGT